MRTPEEIIKPFVKTATTSFGAFPIVDEPKALIAMEEYANQFKPQWISVEEKLYGKKEVLVLYEGEPMIATHYEGGIFRAAIPGMLIDDKDITDCVSHYFILPESPINK